MSIFEIYKIMKPTEFTRLVGVNYGTFEIILAKLKNAHYSLPSTRPNASARFEKFFVNWTPTAFNFYLSSAISYSFATWEIIFNFWRVMPKNDTLLLPKDWWKFLTFQTTKCWLQRSYRLLLMWLNNPLNDLWKSKIILFEKKTAYHQNIVEKSAFWPE